MCVKVLLQASTNTVGWRTCTPFRGPNDYADSDWATIIEGLRPVAKIVESYPSATPKLRCI